MDVGQGVCHLGEAFEEDFAWLVRRGEGGYATVITRFRRNPAGTAGTKSNFSTEGHAGGHSDDGRKLIVGNGDEETSGELIAVDIRGSVGHLGGSHCETIARQMGRDHSCDFTVITAGRSDPARDRGAQARFGTEGHVSRHRVDRRILVIGDGHRVGGGGRVAMDIECGDGHLGGSHVEEVAAGMTRGQRVDTTVISGSGVDPAGDGSTRSRIVRESDIGGSIEDQRAFQIFHRDYETGQSLISVDVSSSQIHLCITHRELIPGSMSQGDSRNFTVIGGSRSTPGNHSSAQSSLTGNGDPLRKTDELWCLLITDGDQEAGSGLVSMNITDGVGHLCTTHDEDVTGRVCRGESTDLAVITGSRSSPHGGCRAKSSFCRQAEIRGQTQQRWSLIIGNRDEEGSRRGVVVVIRGGVGDLGGSHGEELTGLMGRGQDHAIAVIIGSRSSPGY